MKFAPIIFTLALPFYLLLNQISSKNMGTQLLVTHVQTSEHRSLCWQKISLRIRLLDFGYLLQKEIVVGLSLFCLKFEAFFFFSHFILLLPAFEFCRFKNSRILQLQCCIILTLCIQVSILSISFMNYLFESCLCKISEIIKNCAPIISFYFEENSLVESQLVRTHN